MSSSRILRRPFGSSVQNAKLAKELSIIGLGCSSFSSFFDDTPMELKSLDKDHAVVQEWIQTIHYAIQECGINLLDTAPWYGHGTSEVVVGWALEELLSSEKETKRNRQDLVINTKVGRYEADPKEQFDFSYSATMKSVSRSLERLKCQYIDVIQLHDPEFAPSITQLLEETIPAMIECQEKGYCRALGLTGYPLETQYQILQASMERFGKNVFDQALTYGHFNLHDSSLIQRPITKGSVPFADTLIKKHNMGVLAAAPLSMGLLTNDGPPEWHPASDELKQACRKANQICNELCVNISSLAIIYALSHFEIACTILGMKNIEQVKASSEAAARFADIKNTGQDKKEVLKSVLSPAELKAYEKLVDGPFADKCWAWDGIKGAQQFWIDQGVPFEDWQERWE